MLLDAGQTLPKDVLIDDRFRGMSAERIYNLIEEEENQEGSSEQAESKPGGGSGATEDKAPQSDQVANEPQAPLTPGGVGQVLDAEAPVGEEGPSFPSRPGSGRSPSSRQRAWRSWPASYLQALCEALKRHGQRGWTGANFSGGRGPKPPRRLQLDAPQPAACLVRAIFAGDHIGRGGGNCRRG